MGWLITAGILALLAVLPLGVSVCYDAAGPVVRLILGPVRVTLIPAKPKKPKQKKQNKPENSDEKDLPKKPPIPKKEPAADAKGGSWTDFLPLVGTVLEFLGDFRRKLRVNVLELKLILAGDDPCDLAMNYGRAWTAVGNLMPRLERIFTIQKRNVEVECDFTATETLVTARLDLTVTLGRLIGLTVRYAVRLIKQFLQIKNLKKGGAKQ